MRRDGLPLIGSPNKRVREADDHVIGHACEIPGPMCAPCHNRGVAMYLNPHVVDLEAANLVQPLLEHITKDAGPIARPAIRPRASPFGRNDPLDRCPVAADQAFARSCCICASAARSRSGRPSWFAVTVGLDMTARTMKEKVSW